MSGRLGLILVLALATTGWSASLRGAQSWSGVVRVEDDLLVPRGTSLDIAPGTRVVFGAAPSTKTDPPYWNSGTELAVEGTLSVRGTAESPVVFEGDGAWGGLVAAPGGDVSIEGALIRGAQEGLLCVGARCALRGVTISGGDYGVVLGPGARLEATKTAVEGSRVGVLDLRREASQALPPLDVATPTDATSLTLTRPSRGAQAVASASVPAGPRVEFLGDYTVEADQTWQGEVVVTGRVTVTPGAVLTLEPGTRVAFRKVDTDGDNLGEGELAILGGIRSRGTARAPVVFDSAEEAPSPGDWDKVSLISSEDPGNEFRHTVFRHGVQSLHAHFSRFRAADCFFEANLRAAQFQESEGAELTRCVFFGNKQALRFRDSQARVADSVFLDNLYAVHAYRCELEFTGNTLEGNALGGFFAKESRVTFTDNRLRANRDGIRMRDPGSRVTIRANRIEDSAEDAVSLSQVEGAVEGNRLSGAGLDLVAAEDSPVAVTGNDLGPSGRHAVHLKGTLGLDARGNFWGGEDPSGRIHDRSDDSDLGAASWAPVLDAPPRLALPGAAW